MLVHPFIAIKSKGYKRTIEPGLTGINRTSMGDYCGGTIAFFRLIRVAFTTEADEIAPVSGTIAAP